MTKTEVNALKSVDAPIWMLIPRFITAFLYLFLGSRHLLIPESFRRTLELPAEHGILFTWFFKIPLENPSIFEIFRIVVGIAEILIGLALVIGFLLRLMGIISTVLLIFIVISLIPSWFMVIVHGLSLFFSIPLIFFNANRFAPAEKIIPPHLMKWQAKY